jgi:hypothetical protein
MISDGRIDFKCSRYDKQPKTKEVATVRIPVPVVSRVFGVDGLAHITRRAIFKLVRITNPPYYNISFSSPIGIILQSLTSVESGITYHFAQMEKASLDFLWASLKIP